MISAKWDKRRWSVRNVINLYDKQNLNAIEGNRNIYIK